MFRYNQLFGNNPFLSNTDWNILAGFGVITFFVISGYYLANIKKVISKNFTKLCKEEG